MAGLSRQKQKLLIMEQLFNQQTDENHPITGAKLIEVLAAMGIKAERKTIYDDIKTLIDSGMPIETTKSGHSNAYYLADRTFQDEELNVLVDAVASCRFLSRKKSQDLIKKLLTLTSQYKAKGLKRDIYVENREKSINEQIYYAINVLHSGITEKKEVTFKYSVYDADKKKKQKHDGYIYTVSPYRLIWYNENYYLVCYCNKHEKICRYRLDRMVSVNLTDNDYREPTKEESAEFNDVQSIHGMYSGVHETVTMEFDNSLADTVFDKYGVNCHSKRNSETTFTVTTDVQVAPTFWGWFFQFGNKAKILAPENVVEQAKDYLSVLTDVYSDSEQ